MCPLYKQDYTLQGHFSVVCPSVYATVCPSVCLSVCLYGCLCIRLSFRHTNVLGCLSGQYMILRTFVFKKISLLSYVKAYDKKVIVCVLRYMHEFEAVMLRDFARTNSVIFVLYALSFSLSFQNTKHNQFIFCRFRSCIYSDRQTD